MIGQLLDAARQNGNLHFWGTRIRIMTMIVRDQFCLNFFRERHDVCFPFYKLWRQKPPHYAGLRTHSLTTVWQDQSRAEIIPENGCIKLQPGSRYLTRSVSILAGKLLLL